MTEFTLALKQAHVLTSIFSGIADIHFSLFNFSALGRFATQYIANFYCLLDEKFRCMI